MTKPVKLDDALIAASYIEIAGSQEFIQDDGTLGTRLGPRFSAVAGGVGTVSNHPFDLYTNNTRRGGLSAAGAFDLTGVADLSASGLLVPKGNWTPSDGSGAGLTIKDADGVSAVTGRYEKIDRLVVARTAMFYPVNANASPAEISGLPFSVATGTPPKQAICTYSDLATFRSGLPVGSHVVFYKLDGSSVLNSDLSGKTIYITALYQT